MSSNQLSERHAKVIEIAERVVRLGTVYDRLPRSELTRKRKFLHLGSPKKKKP